MKNRLVQVAYLIYTVSAQPLFGLGGEGCDDGTKGCSATPGSFGCGHLDQYSRGSQKRRSESCTNILSVVRTLSTRLTPLLTPDRYVDLHKAYSVILGNLYKTLYNIIARRQAEQDAPDVRAVLEKRERSDVSQDESLLSRLERDMLADWGAKQERLAVLEMRVEETVFLLRDLGVLGINDD